MTQREALQILRMGHNVYLTGPAGSGKTRVLNQYILYLQNWRVRAGITASTGIAATHLGGRTIHSWAGIGIKDALAEVELKELAKSQKLKRRFQETRVLLIDEISMLDARRFDLVDRIIRSASGKQKPFGGMQVVLSGDLFQLPPVQSVKNSDVPFVYKSAAWDALAIKVCYLHEQHRQTDNDCLAVLRAIRQATISRDTLEYLNMRRHASIPGSPRLTTLYTHNIDVDALNEQELAKIPGAPLKFFMEERGVPALVEELKRGCLAPAELRLKRGAFVMFVKNRFEKGYMNGTLGTVTGFDDSGWPVVRTTEGKTITATPESWTIGEDEAEAARISQIPLRLAWAITIHKSQGMTLDAAEIDLSKAFEQGMGYVALSRVRTLDMLRLLGWNNIALQVNPEVLAFDRELRIESGKAEKSLRRMPYERIREREQAFLRSGGVVSQAAKEPPGNTVPSPAYSVAKMRRTHRRAYE